MKLYRNAIILVVILGVLAGSYVFLKNRETGGTAKDEGNSDIVKIIDVELSKIKEMTVENAEGVFKFVKKDEEWAISSPEGLKVDKTAINGIATNIYSVSADKLVEENPSDLSQYGLDDPAVITIKMENGETKALELGAQTPTKTGYYAREKGSSKVYVIDSYTGGKLDITKNSIRDKAIFSVKQEDVTGLAMERNGEMVFKAKKVGESKWLLDYPIDANAEFSAMAPMIASMEQLNVVSFVEENPADLGKYGLDKPHYTLELDTAKEKTKLLFGAEKEKGTEVYAMFDGQSEVFTLDLSSFTFLDKPFKEIIESFAHIVSIWDVSKIEVEMDGQKMVSEISATQGGDDDKFTVNGKNAAVKDENDKQPFRAYYQALIGVTLSDLDMDAEPSGNAEITITYHQKVEPKLVKMEFIRKNDRFYYVVKNGKYTSMVVDKAKFGEIRDAYKSLTEAMEKK